MGLFSSKKTVTVATSVSRVIADSIVPDSVRSATMRSVYARSPLVEDIMRDSLSSIGTKAERMYQFGKREYVYGLPTSGVHQAKSTAAIVQDVIEMNEGRAVVLDYYTFGSINYLHYGWQSLVNMYGYDQRTNELKALSALKRVPVYLSDLRVVVKPTSIAEFTPNALNQYGSAATAGYTPLSPMQTGAIPRAQTPVGVDSNATEDYLLVSYVWTDPLTRVVRSEQLTFGIPLDISKQYFQAKYHYLVGSPGVPQYEYFTYLMGSGVHISLDMLYSTEYDDLGQFFPYGYFRYNAANTSTNPNSDDYTSSTKLMRYLGINYDQVADSINANPNINSVESAVLMMAVSADTQNPIEQRYLFDFFRGIYIQSGSVGSPMSAQAATVAQGLYGGHTANPISMVIQDRRFKTALNMEGIYRKLHAGVIGKVGTYTSGSSSIVVAKSGTKFNNQVATNGALFTWSTTVPSHYYRKQISSRIYEEIHVLDVDLTYYVWGGYSTTNRMIPIDHSITANYSALDREELYARSLHYVFNSKHVTTLKWYQQEWFRYLIIVVALALTAWSGGIGGGASSGLISAIAAGTATLEFVVMSVIVKAVEYAVSQLVMNWLVKQFGPEFALVASLVLMAVVGLGSMGGTGTGGVPFSSELLQMSSGLMQKAGEYYTDAIKGINESALEFSLYADAKVKELETANKLLENDGILSPLVVFGESPDEYYYRSVHSGNIGVLSLDVISNFVDVSLTLPSIDQSLNFNGDFSVA